MNMRIRRVCLLVCQQSVALLRSPGIEKRMLITKCTIFILMLTLLSSCTGSIPITGQNTPSVATTESTAVPASTQIVQPSPEVTVSSSPSTVPSATSACQTPNASVKPQNAYLRDGPDLRFVAKSRYQNGDQFTVLGRYKDWFHVESPNGQQGWLYKEWLSIPPSIDTNNICPVSEQELPPTPQPPKKKPHRQQQQEPGACVPTYYASCP